MGKPRETLAALLRRLIAEAPVSRWRISQETGIAESILSRFIRGERDVSLDVADKLLAYFSVQLQPPRTGRAAKTSKDK